MSLHPFDKIDLIAFVAGDCDAKKSEIIGEHLRSCASCRSYIHAIESEKTEFLKAHPYAETIRSDRTVEAPRTLLFRSRRIYGIAACIAVLLTAGYFFRMREPAPSFRTKGEIRLTLFVKNSRGEIERRNNQTCETGERIQFLYSCGALNQFMLLSIDTAGAITRYYPLQGDSSIAVPPGQDVPLPHSILLDDYTGKELFLAIFSEKKLHVPTILNAIKARFDKTRMLDSVAFSGKGIAAYKQALMVQKGVR